MTKDEALKMAISQFKRIDKEYDCTEIIDICKEALETPECNTHPDAPHGFCRDASHSANRYVCECEFWEQPAQEPVAWMDRTYGNLHKVNYGDSIPLYTHPTPSWQGLSDDEILDLATEFLETMSFVGFARAIEQALRNKNDI